MNDFGFWRQFAFGIFTMLAALASCSHQGDDCNANLDCGPAVPAEQGNAGAAGEMSVAGGAGESMEATGSPSAAGFGGSS